MESLSAENGTEAGPELSSTESGAEAETEPMFTESGTEPDPPFASGTDAAAEPELPPTGHESDPAAQPSADLQKQLERAREDLEAVEEQWRIRIRDIQNRRDDLQFQYDRVLSGETSSQEALEESYEAAVKQEEEAWKAEEEKLEALRQNVENAQWELDVAARQDAYASLTEDQRSRLAQIDRRLQELTISGVERRLGELETMIAADGKVCASTDGTVVVQELVPGRTSTGEERLVIAFGSRIFEAEFDKKGQEMSVGDRLSIAIPGSSRSVEATITGMNLLGEENGVFRADLDELALPIGTVTSYQCRRVSDTYQMVIPLEALRRDANGYYCLAVRSKSGVMGQEFQARRVELQVLDQGSTEAAVEGALSASDEVITAGNKFISDGSRVRPVEDLGQ